MYSWHLDYVDSFMIPMSLIVPQPDLPEGVLTFSNKECLNVADIFPIGSLLAPYRLPMREHKALDAFRRVGVDAVFRGTPREALSMLLVMLTGNDAWKHIRKGRMECVDMHI